MRQMLLSRRLLLFGGASLAMAPPAWAQGVKRIDALAQVFRRPPVGMARGAAVPDYLAELDAAGMTHGVIVQPPSAGIDNGYLLESLKAARGRLRGVAAVEPSAYYNDLKALDAAGVVGLRLDLSGRPIPDFGAQPWPDFLKRVASLGWSVHAHREAKDLPRIVGPLLAAGLTVVVDHYGRPDPALGVDDPGFRYLLTQGASRRLWIKLSGAHRNGGAAAGERIALAAYPLLRAALGADRLLFGSDWPHGEGGTGIAGRTAIIERSAADPSERRMVLGENAATLLRL
jgi:predicted TIM-barrel fold metal-dependent hydrolase